jgi:hypothetical protein
VIGGLLSGVVVCGTYGEGVVGFWDGISFAVTDAVQSAQLGAAVAAVGGGVTMDRDEMTNFLEQVKKTRELCQQQVYGNRRVAKVMPPAEDQASVMFTNAAQTSRDAREKYLQEQLDMYNQLVDKLQKALGITTEADQQAADTVNKAAGGGKYS